VYITDATTSKAAWDMLANTYAPKGVITVVFLRRQLARLRCEEGANIKEHICTLTNLCSKLVAQRTKLAEEEYSITLLTSLLNSWDTFISRIDMASLTESTKLVARILEQDRRRLAKPSSDEVALPANFHKHQRAKQPPFSPKVICYGCGQIRHMIGDCRDVKAEKHIPPPRSRTLTNHKERYANKHHTHLVQSSSNSDTDFAFMAQDTISPLPHGSWIADSSASKHILMSKDFFQSYTIAGNHTVSGLEVSDATELAPPPSLLTLKTLSTTSHSGMHSMSLRHLTTSSPKHVEIMHGKKVGNLYHVTITCGTIRSTPAVFPVISSSLLSPSTLVPSSESQSVVPLASPSSPALSRTTPAFAAVAAYHSWDKWHRIFGHIPPASVKLLKNNNMVEGMNINSPSTPSAQCATCIKAKSHVAPFPAQAEHEYTEIGEMIFTDVWGPLWVTGIRGERYYISFTDAAKHRTIIYTMKKPTEVLG
jgi:hypothetical protein